MSKYKYLLLKYQDSDTMSYLSDWEFYFRKMFKDKIDVINIKETSKYNLKKSIYKADFIIGLHSLLRTSKSILEFKKYIDLFYLRKNCLLMFVGDELNLHNSPLSFKLNILKELSPDFIATQLSIDAGNWLYSDINSKVVSIPHALNEDYWLYNKNVIKDIDISGISVKYPIYLGDNLRNKIYDKFLHFGKKFNKNIYITQNNSNRLDRENWRNLLFRSRCTISSEAGTDYLEKDDYTINEIVKYFKDFSQINNFKLINTNYKAYNFIPKKIKGILKNLLQKRISINYKTLDQIMHDDEYFNEIFDLFFKNYKKLPFNTKAISSRHFEAIGSATCQIMFPGFFNGILIKDEHYISLNEDFSNFDLVIEKINDSDYLSKINMNAINHVLDSHTIKHRVKQIENLL